MIITLAGATCARIACRFWLRRVRLISAQVARTPLVVMTGWLICMGVIVLLLGVIWRFFQ